MNGAIATNNKVVILSEAKDLLEGIDRRKMILRFAQDDICSFVTR